MGGNQHVKRTQGGSLPFQVGSKVPISAGRHVVVRENLDGSQKFGQGQFVLLGFKALRDPSDMKSSEK